MKSFREWLVEKDEQKEVNEGLVFSAKNKSPLDLLDISVKSVKGMIDNLNDIKEIKEYQTARKEAKMLADKIEELYEKYSK